MNLDEAKKIIVDECLKPGGFAIAIRENRVDEDAFARLIKAVHEFGRATSGEHSIDRLTIACLFELPWEIENTVDHYSKYSPELGSTVSKMADKLRASINDLLWSGLESHYDRI